MPTPANRAVFTLDIAGLEHDLRVLEFTAKESISRPFSVRVELVSERNGFKLEDLLQRMAFLRFDEEGNGFHGQIGEVARGDSGKRFTHYFIQLVPSIKRLEHRRNQRIFQHKSVPQIIAQVLKDQRILSNEFEFSLREPHEPLDYCTQYQETDLHFIRRLCEEAGISFHFTHSCDQHQLIFTDAPATCRRSRRRWRISKAAPWRLRHPWLASSKCASRPARARPACRTTILKPRASTCSAA